MNAKISLSQLVATWSAQAVQTWGDDWAKISDHIAACYAALPSDEQKRLAAEAKSTLFADQLGAAALRH
jgi:hypothetical protein